MSCVRVAITGGPCAGKTTVMEAIKKHLGDQVLVMPEVASILLDNGFPRPGKDVDAGDRWLMHFQRSVLPVQLNMEEEYLQMVARNFSRVLLFDRGLLDGAAYLGRGVEFFAEHFGFDLNEAYGRYDLVLHLESVAVSDPQLYEQLKATNPARYETAEEAATTDLAIREVWQGHPNWRLIPSGGGIKQVKAMVSAILAQYLSTEIEVKYFLAAMPDIALPEGVRVLQGYLPLSTEVRLRMMGDDAYLTIKGQGTHSRTECERMIDLEAFHPLWAEVTGRVEKTRYFIPHGDLTLELDQYHGPLEGLVTLECEFLTEDQMALFALPDWAAGATDVTDDPRYKNRQLAYQGVPSGR
jgi:adenylate cyclase